MHSKRSVGTDNEPQNERHGVSVARTGTLAVSVHVLYCSVCSDTQIEYSKE
jgi:hypothetical protein